MDKQPIFLAITSTGLTVTTTDNPTALAQIAITSNYVFDSNVELAVKVTDVKTPTTTADPLDSLVFSLRFQDKITGSTINTMQGRLFTGGGIEALEESYSQDFAYIARKLDFYGAMDDKNDFFDVVETRYNMAQKDTIIQVLNTAGILSSQPSYRTKEQVLGVPASTGDNDTTPDDVRKLIIKANPRPTYIAMTDISSLPMIEAVMNAMDQLNIHMFIDVGEMTDWRNVSAFVNSLQLDDARVRILWNPNKARPNNASSVLARRTWRPCVGDYLAQHLLRNALRDNNGTPPLHVPVAGYDFPLSYRGMQQLDGIDLDEEAQNALAEAGIIVVLNERYQNETRWIYGDVLTQRDSKTSALRLANAAEIETFTANGVNDIVKKHMLTNMSSYLVNAYRDCTRFLDNCQTAGLLKPSQDLNGKYYALAITPKADNPFEAVDVQLARRPEGAVRQAYSTFTINK